jgi:excisionase family DNA binding protein
MGNSGQHVRTGPHRAARRGVPRPAWLSAASAAQYIDVSVGTISNLTRRGKLHAYPVAGTSLKRYRRTELDELLETGVDASATSASVNAANPGNGDSAL